MEVPIENNVSAKVYRKDPIRKMIITAVIIAMYAIALPFCYYTAGEPRRAAMIQAQRIADEKWAADILMLHNEQNNTSSSSEFVTPTNEIVYDEEDSSSANKILAEMNAAGTAVPVFQQQQTNTPTVVDEFADTTIDYTTTQPKSESSSSSWLAGWLGPTKEQKRQKAEFDKWQKELQEKSGDTIALPPEYLPSAWACLALFLCISLHALFHLMCHWVVSFKATSLYKAAEKVDEHCFVLIVPPANRGSAALVAMKKAPSSGITTPFAEFQRQKYIYLPSNLLGDQSKKYPKGVFTLASYPINLPISHYLSATGIPSEGEITKLTEKWGKNHLAVAIPSFFELLQIQLLSPLAIFQVFCAILWLLDEYWTYTLFSLFSVVMYEATTVFQRTRTQQMLGGMSPKPSPIYVYRCGKWSVISSKDLLPGDLISLSFKKRATNRPTPIAATTTATNSTVAKKDEDKEEKHIPITSKDDIIPCDCVLVKGSAVVNEASLTGESVPQMKEAIVRTEKKSSSHNTEEVEATTTGEEKLDMSGAHRVHTLFAGCSLVTVTGKTRAEVDASDGFLANIPNPPDDGALAYVLRTGFGSSQGSLLQMIEYSQQTVSGDIKETGLALFLLFVFAMIASGYVLKEGLRKKEKTTHELLLKCVIIITSVVPRQFPMQMAVAVNMALMALSKAGIFCTEPYRVPLAGKVSHCLFDKTGTITTDQLVPVGIINYNSVSTSAGEDSSLTAGELEGGLSEAEKALNIPPLSLVTAACAETALILAACHSLVVVEEDDDKGTDPTTVDLATTTPLPANNLTGDPIELAAIRAIDWHWDGPTSTASPDGAVRRHHYALQLAKTQKRRLQGLTPEQRGPNYAKEVETTDKEIQNFENKISAAKIKAAAALYHSVQVVQRHHFSSALQRMSVVVKCNNRTAGRSSSNDTIGSSSSSDHWYCLVKGSPEALRKLILADQLPSWYTPTYEALARRGLRVLALAYKKVSAKDRPQEQPRQWVESNLCGFIAFECKVRGDSGIVIQSLLESDHKVAMLTGDALLTSLHVAKQVGICHPQWQNLTLDGLRNEKNQMSVTTASDFFWTAIDDIQEEKTKVSFQLDQIPTLATKYNLLTTEDVLLAYLAVTGQKTSPMWKYVRFFKVFARMSPQGKANIIKAIQDSDPDFHVFMCGDGGNDVGALKQADIGLALLAGHANANTSEELGKEGALVPAAAATTNKTTAAAAGGAAGEGKSAEDILNAHQQKLQSRSEELNKARIAHMKDFQAKYQREQQIWLQEEIKRRTEAGDYMAMWTLMKDQAAKVKQAMAEENQRFMAMHGQIWDPKDGDGSSKSTLEELMAGMDSSSSAGGLPMVRPGDASVAAPFTSRIPSIRAVVDLIRQGRCTLLSALMQQQIMMLESTISAYTLSSLSLHNARSSERQMMASSWLILTAAVSFSYASPVDHMHPLRPLRSLFHPAVFVSMLGQAVIHILCMTLAVQWATEAMGDEKLKEVTEFFRKVKANEIDRSAHCAEEDFMCQFQSYWMAPFLPNLLNSVVFLVETSQMISVFFANYKGRPWMKGILENHALFLSVFLCVTGVVIAAWEMIPQANELIQLAPFPNDAFRYKVVFLVISTIVGTIAWDRFCVYLFAPDVFQATWKELKKTTIYDFLPILTTFLKIIGVLIILGTGNILLAGLAFWWYRSYYSKKN